MPVRSLIRSLWDFRGFVASAVAAEYRSRFARSRFGFAWLVLQPLFQVAIFALVLAEVLGARLPGVESAFGYAAYLLTGILAWSLFADLMQRLSTVFIDNASLLKKLSVPRAALPLVAVGSVGVTHVALMTILLIALPVLGFQPSLHWLWLPVLTAITVLLALGLGIIVGTINVVMRDAAQVLGVLLQLGFWMTPIVYHPDVLPDALQPWVALNPMAVMVMAFHDVMLFRAHPGWGVLCVAVGAMGLNALGWWVFRRASTDVVDAL